MNLQIGDDEDRMEVALLHGRDGHIILVDVLEILIGVVWCRELRVLEAYLAQGQHGGSVVGDAIAVHRRDVGVACRLAAKHKHTPKSSIEQLLASEPEKLSHGAQRVAMGVVENRHALRDADTQPFDPRFRCIGMAVEGEDVDIDALLIVIDEVVDFLDIERVEVTHLHVLRPHLRIGFPRLYHQVLRQIGLSLLDKAAEILHVHGDVDVVVPWDKSTVAHGTQQRTAIEPIADAHLPASLVDVFENLQLFQLAGPQIGLVILIELLFVVHVFLFDYKGTANEWKAQIKWNENKLWEKAKDIEKENVSLQYIHYYKRKEETWPQPTR